ncbi:hypothetical protein [Methylorubrum podarium]|uniref:hypothetical protein n=1 Tax=Methylorubrum podarium TaxID=200476 RepID=UPI001EE2EB3D|nr:hypothetical protein [Methylorubrum podarium]GJE71923.1 hypothetical protein CHKEEEPN_3475 [Methylorubrum podarium]
MSTVIPFFRPASARQGNWSQQELAEFYRVEAALLRAGFSIASEHGLSDEGEPWFVFCRPDGDAIIHFAKIDGSYLIASEALDRPVRGTDFRTLIDQIARLHPHLLPIPATGTGTTLVVHPAALLAALVAAAALSLSSEDAHAGPLLPGGEGVSAPPASDGGGPAQGQPQPKATGGSGDRDIDRKQLEAIILSAMIFAAEAMAVDHRAVSAELNLDFADGAGNASSPTPQGDTTLAPGTALGYGRGGVSVQPAVLTAQGSGANPDARPQSASDTIAVSSRVDPVPVARTEFASEALKSPASQNQPLAPGFGSDVTLTGTSAEASAAKSGGHQASTSGRSESAAPASDESGPASIAEPDSHARPAHAASSDPANAGSGPARPAWVNDLPQIVTSRMPSPEASHEADDRGHGRPAEAALGSSPMVDLTGPGRGHVEDVGRDRGSPAEAGAETHPTGEQAVPARSEAGVDQGRGVPAETAAGSSSQVQHHADSGRQAISAAAVQRPQAEAAIGSNPQAEPVRPGQGFVDTTGQDRGSPAVAAGGHGPNAEQLGPGQGQAGDRGQDQGAPAAASHEMRVEQTSPLDGPVNTVGPDRPPSPVGASGNNPQTASTGGGNGHAIPVARNGEASAHAEAGSNPTVEQTGRGSDHARGVAQQETSPVQADAGNSPPVEEAGRGSGHARVVAREWAPQAEAAAGNNPRTVQADPSDGHTAVSGQGSARAESVIGDRPEIQQAGRASGQENANDQGSWRPTEAASRNDPPFEATGGNDGQGHGSSSQAEAAAHRELGSSAAIAGHFRAPNDANERGSTVRTETVLPGTEQQADRGNGRSPAPAERSAQQAPEAYGPGATDTAPGHGNPDIRGDARSDAAPTTKAHAPPDLDSTAHGSNKLSAIELSGDARGPTNGPAQDPTSSPSEHPRGNSIGHDSDHAPTAAVSELTNGDMSGTKEHGSSPSDVAVTSPSTVHAGGTGSQAWLAQEGSAPHGQSADGEPAIPASAARDPVSQDRGSDRAEAENPLRHAASPASDAQFASPKGEHAEAGPDGSHDGAGPVVDRAIPAADPQAMVHGVDENGLPDPSGGPNRTSPSASISQDETASAHFDRGQVDDAPSVSGRGDREAPGQAAHPVKTEPPTEPPVQVEAGLADGLSPSGQSGSEASHGASHGASGETKPGRPSPPPAAIDADGNLVFHTDAHQDPVPSALPHGPDEATTHHAVGLIGVSDQAHPVHDMYHHT